MHVASLFPLPDPDNFGANIWIYMLYLTQGVNTNSRQVLDALAGLAELKEYEESEDWDPTKAKNASAAQAHQIRVSEIAVNLYGRELAATTIPAGSVWAAFHIQRSWNSVKTWKSAMDNSIRNKPDYTKGGTYRIAEIRNNDRAQITSEELRVAKGRFLTAMQKNPGPHQMPTHEQGFHPSNVKALS